MEGCYPKWVYHAEKGAVVVHDHDEHNAIGPDWAESPVEVQKAHEEGNVAYVPDVQTADVPKKRGRKPRVAE